MKNRRDYGSGSINYHQDSKLYQGRVYIKQDGKRIRKSIYGKTKREVQQKLIELMTEANNGTLVQSSTFNFGTWLNEWFENKKSRIKPNTIMYIQGL